MKKIIILGVIFLFVGMGFQPAFANDNNTSNCNENQQFENNIFIKNNPNNINKEMVKLTCCYFTLDGIIPVIREVTVEGANFLSHLLKGSDIDAIVSELNRLNLISDKIGIEKTKELVSGRYGQKISQKPQNIRQSMDTDWKENYNCNITGQGVDAYFMPLTLYYLLNILQVGYAILTLPITVPLFLLAINAGRLNNTYLFLSLLGLILAILSPIFLLERYLTYGRPIKATSDKIIANLFDAMGDGNPYLNTTGDNGTWGFEEKYRGIAMYMQGFYGIWLSINDGRHAPGADVKGYCDYIKAKGMSDWPWDGWEDDGWPW